MLIADVSYKSAVAALRYPAFDGLSDAEWRELTELVFACADDRLASVVYDIAGIARRTPMSAGGTPETKPARASRQKRSTTRALLAREEFYRTLLQALRRRSVH